jgi:hypothetical protein
MLPLLWPVAMSMSRLLVNLLSQTTLLIQCPVGNPLSMKKYKEHENTKMLCGENESKNQNEPI